MLTIPAEPPPQITPERIKLVEPQPPENAPPEEFWKRVRWYVLTACLWCLKNPGWFGSALFHTAVVICLADVLLNEQQEQRRVGIEAVLAQEGQEDGFDMALDQSALFESAPSEASERPSDSTEVLPADPLGRSAAQLTGTTRLSLAGQGSGTDGEAIPTLSGTGFFGTAAAGKSFVYVVDMSQSMEEGDRFRRAKAELKRSIGKLKPEQKFYVIFFNDQAFPMFFPRPAQNLINATGSNRSKAARWINNLRPFSVTNPEPALQMAIEMKPDVIFFLTDGDFDIEVRESTMKANKGRIVIHTIAFASDAGKLILEQMAKDNGGTYRFVP